MEVRKLRPISWISSLETPRRPGSSFPMSMTTSQLTPLCFLSKEPRSFFSNSFWEKYTSGQTPKCKATGQTKSYDQTTTSSETNSTLHTPSTTKSPKPSSYLIGYVKIECWISLFRTTMHFSNDFNIRLDSATLTLSLLCSTRRNLHHQLPKRF